MSRGVDILFVSHELAMVGIMAGNTVEIMGCSIDEAIAICKLHIKQLDNDAPISSWSSFSFKGILF